jgi:hypothetical protein
VITILDLWLPVLLSSVFVFLVSFVLHMVLTYHRADYKKLPNEDATLEALRQTTAAAGPGFYFFPWAMDAGAMKSPEMMEKFKRGPVGMLTIRPSGAPQLGGHLVSWFVYTLVIGVFSAYLAGRTLPSGTPYLEVFRFVGTAAFMAYGVGQIVDSIWKAIPWSNTVRALVDGLIYSLVTAGTFGWLWPR